MPENIDLKDELVIFEKKDRFAIITLNDTKRRNGLTPELISSLIKAIEKLETDEDIACGILTATGQTFSAGGNPKKMIEKGAYPDMTPYEIRQSFTNGIQKMSLALYGLKKPIIAAINGAAIGAGCDLACMCDLRICSTNSSFASSFVKLGLVPGDGGAWFLPRAIGLAKASQMILTGTPIDAETAFNFGLVSKVTSEEELLDEAIKLAKSIASNPSVATRFAKSLLRDSARQTINEALDYASSLQAIAMKTEDHKEAVMAVIEQRKPIFSKK